MQKRVLVGIVGLALMLFHPVCAQKEGAVWYFGNKAGLDFNQQYPRPLTDGQTGSPEGVAAISDKEGNLLFYTDGQTVFNQSHTIMPNGQGLSGNNTATQSSLIVPWPKYPDKYYLFTLGKVGTSANQSKDLYYSIVNLSTNQVDPVYHNRLLLENCTEKITAIRNRDGTGWWILAHQVNTSEFNEYLLSDTLQKKDDQVIGFQHLIDINNPDENGAAGYLKASPGGDFVALATEGTQDFHFEIFRFDNSTGKLLQNPPPVKLQSESMYGVEFSPAGKYLYGTSRRDGVIFRWNLEDFSETAVKNSREIIFSDPSLSIGALQLAPNGKIYIAFDNQSWSGVIHAPDLDSCGFVKKGASLYDYTLKKKGISGYGLPNFPSVFFHYDFYYSNDCVNDTTVFYPESMDMVDFPPKWYIEGIELSGDEQTYGVTYQFTQPGEYTIGMEGSKNGNRVNLERVIRIHPRTVIPVNDTTYLCAGQPLILHNGNYAFYGITNEAGEYTDSVRSVDQPGTYRITATNYQGCSQTITTVARAIDSPEIDSIAVVPASCTGAQNGSIRILMKGNLSDYNFIWADGHPDTNYRERLKPGAYGVTISLKEGCAVDTTITVETSKLVVKIKRFPEFPSPVCPGSEITLTASGADTFEWAHAPGVFQKSVTVYPVGDSIFRVTGSSGGLCFGYDSVRIEVFENTKLDLGPDLSACFGQPIVIRGKDYDPGSVYTEWNWSTGQKTDSIVLVNSISNLSLRVKDINGCYSTDDINITFDVALRVRISSSVPVTSPVCPGTEIILSASGANSLIWEHEPGVHQVSVKVKPDRDTIYIVNGSNGGTCTGSDSIRIRIAEKSELELGADRTACLGETIVIRRADYDPESLFQDWNWSTGATTDSLIANASIPNLTLTANDRNGCPYSDSIAVVFTPLPVIKEVVKKDITCSGMADGSLDIRTEGISSRYQYSIDDGTTWTAQSLYANRPAGEYAVQVKNDSGCMSLTSVATILEPEPLTYASRSVSPSCPECTDGEIRITASGGTSPYTFDWQGFNVHDSIFTDIGADNYTITITDKNGCTLSIDFPLTAGELFIPNAFSPNGGSRNEKWMIRILENRSDCLVQVYDRSGKLVYFTDQVYEPWDGTYLNQGQELPAGTYFYRIQIDRNDTNKPPQLGTVTILR